MITHVLDSALESVRREFDARCNEAAARARAEFLQSLNQLFRRFRSYQNECDWMQTTLDAAAPYANETALFGIVNQTLQLRGQNPSGLLPEGLTISISEACAIVSAIESKDPVTALRTPKEVSAILSKGHESECAHLMPIMNGDRVSAILFASDAGSDVNGLELVAGIASSMLERKANFALHAQIAPITEVPKTVFGTVPARPTEPKLPAWNDLPTVQRQLHIRAQRFARVAIAEMQLARPEACRAGREQSDLYLFLKREIDNARENFRKQFMTVPSMMDYLHLELIQTAAEGDERKLGADYPGRLQ